MDIIVFFPDKSLVFNILNNSLFVNEFVSSVPKSSIINRQALHCNHISFIHPITHQNLNIDCELPLDMKLIIRTIAGFF